MLRGDQEVGLLVVDRQVCTGGLRQSGYQRSNFVAVEGDDPLFHLSEILGSLSHSAKVDMGLRPTIKKNESGSEKDG